MTALNESELNIKKEVLPTFVANIKERVLWSKEVLGQRWKQSDYLNLAYVNDAWKCERMQKMVQWKKNDVNAIRKISAVIYT